MKKRVLEDNVANITRSGKHYKPSFLEKDYLGRDIGERSKPTKPKGKEEKEEEDRVLTRLKKRVLEDNVANITRSEKHYKSSFLEKDYPG